MRPRPWTSTAPSLPASGDSGDVEVRGSDAPRRSHRPARRRETCGSCCSRPAKSGGFFSSSPLVVAALVVFFAVASCSSRCCCACSAGRCGRCSTRREDRRGRLQPQGAGGRKRRDGGAGQRVQQDERPPQRADGRSCAASRWRSTGRCGGSARRSPRASIARVCSGRRRDGAGGVRREVRDDRAERPRGGGGRGRGALATAIQDLVAARRGGRAEGGRARRAARGRGLTRWRARCGASASRRRTSA